MTQMQSAWMVVGVYLLGLNLATFAAFALDKSRAVRGVWRVRESTLLLLALFGGSPAAKMAQRFLRHKTRKQPFAGALNLFIGIQIVGLVVAGFLVV